MRYLALAALCLAAAGCETTEVVTLRNSAGMVATCGPYDNRPLNSVAASLRETQCISDYQRQGYQRAAN